MKSIHHLFAATIIIVVIAIAAPALLSAEDTHSAYANKPLSYWLKIIRDRDERMLSLAFDAVRSFGPAAGAAVPELTRVVAAPFTPIHIGKDSHEAIASKVVDITVRGEAIDTLAVIGESASTSTLPLIRWAMTQRVVPGIMRNADDDELFIELVMMDTEQRMRVVGAIAQFGPGAAPLIAALISSNDTEKRKLGVAILSQGALPVASGLLRSSKCDERALGFQILKDMDLIVAKPYLDELTRMLVCDAN